MFFVVVFTLVPKEDAEKDGAGVTTAASDGIAKTGDDKKEEYQPKDDDLD